MKYLRMIGLAIKARVRSRRVRRILRLSDKIGRDSVVLPRRVVAELVDDLVKIRLIVDEVGMETISQDYLRINRLVKRCSFQLQNYDD